MQTIKVSPQGEIFPTRSYRIDLEPDSGSGNIEGNRFHTGLHLRVISTQLQKTTVITGKGAGFPVGFGFCLEGCFESRSECAKTPLLCKSGLSGFFRCPEAMDATMTVARGSMTYAVLGLQTETLHMFAESDEENLSPLLERMSTSDPCLLFNELTPAMRTVFHQIRNCPYVGTIREVFLESKAMELLAYKLDQLRGNHIPQHPHPPKS